MIKFLKQNHIKNISIAEVIVRYWPYLLIFLIGFFVYSPSIWYPPTYLDDIRYLTSVASVNNPFVYFVSDHGHGNNLYRPITSLTQWVMYRLFNIFAMPNQIVNLSLHIITSLIFFKVLLKILDNKLNSFLICLLFLVSPNVMWPATQVSDRPQVFVGLVFVSFLFYIIPRFKFLLPQGQKIKPLNYGALVGFAVAGVLNKESGLVIALLFLPIFFLDNSNKFKGSRSFRLIWLTLLILLMYLVFRSFVFGPNTASYSQNGYLLLAMRGYSGIDQLPLPLNYLAYAENVVKSIVSPILPIFSGIGGIPNLKESVSSLPFILLTPLLFVLAIRKKISKLQLFGLLIIVMNGILHFALFRYRGLYIAQIGFCLFVAGSLIWQSKKMTNVKLSVIQIVVIILTVYSSVWMSWWLTTHLVQRYTYLEDLKNYIKKPVIDLNPDILKRIVEKYGPYRY